MIEPPRPRYQQLADLLREAIQRGDYPPGSMLPSQPELARQHGINQTSVGKAVAILHREGLVRVERGRGAYVLELPVTRRIRRIPAAGDRQSTFAMEMHRLGLQPSTELVAVEEVEPPDDIAEHLQMDEGERTLMRRRQMYASGKPVQLATSYIPMSIIGDRKLVEPDTNPAQLYERLAERGHRATHFSEEVEVRRPTLQEAGFLAISEDQPVLAVVRVVRDQNHRPMDAALNVLAGLQWKLVYEWDQPAEGAP